MLDLETGTHNATLEMPRPVMPPRSMSTATLVEQFGAPSNTTLVDENVFFVLPEKDKNVNNDSKASTDTDATVVSAAAAAASVEAATNGSTDAAAASAAPLDGGFAAWSQVVAGILLNAIAWGTGYVFGIYQLYYTQTLGMDGNAVSWVGSLQTFLTYFFSTVSGLLSDAGYARHVAVAGTVLVLAGGLGTSFAAPAAPLADGMLSQDVPAALFVSQALVTGTGLGLLTASALPSINARFLKKRSLALGLSTFGTGVGGTTLPAVVQYLLPAVGLGWAVRCATLLSVVVCVVAILLLRPVDVAGGKSEDKAVVEEKSVKADDKPTLLSRLASFAAQIIDTSALRELPFVLFMAGSFLLYWGLYFGFYYINTYAEEVVGFAANRATVLLIMSNALGLPSRVLAGAIADCYVAGPLDTLAVSAALQGTTLLAWLAVGRSVTGMYLFVVFFGLCNGATQGVWVGALSTLSSSSPSSQQRFGARFGMVCVVAAVATLAGAPTASALIGDASLAMPTSYHTAMIWAAATTLASATVMMGARVRFLGWRRA